jgi:hypothetical protein
MANLQSVLDPNVDTLILAECVLAYLSPESSNAMLERIASILNRTFAVCYEMCVAGDDHVGVLSDPTPPSKFGTVMLNNLQVSIELLMRLTATAETEYDSALVYRQGV